LSLLINGKACASLHFVGIVGSGMSAIAYYCRGEHIAVTGSDRLAQSVDVAETRKKLEIAGCIFSPQDGSGVSRATDAVVVSTAIEETNPDIVEARKRGIPVVHRSDVLAAVAAAKRTIAIAGTSGKSTVAAMVFEMLTLCGKSPSLVTGANLTFLEEQGLLGNAFHGTSDLMVIEADESDGSLVKYKPDASVFLNLSKDHKPVEEIAGLFEVLAARSKCVIVNADDPALGMLSATTTFGQGPGARYRPDRVDATAPFVVFHRGNVRFELPAPGAHNLSNALAALCAANYLGCDDTRCAAAMSGFKGVKRRFSIVGSAGGITVIDDFAHNPEKVKAAVTTAKSLCRRVLAIFQPHGFGPTKFLKDDFVQAFSEVLGEQDVLYLLPIYYAGGTALKDISSGEIASLVAMRARRVFAPGNRAECLAMVKAQAAPGDAVLLMGARDPSLPSFARHIAEELGSLQERA
jgi:UDP-N-acetylmuramate--alanine ligase